MILTFSDNAQRALVVCFHPLGEKRRCIQALGHRGTHLPSAGPLKRVELPAVAR